MKKVICFGEILWDNLPNGRLAGGAPMNVAYHLRKLGIDSAMLSRVGNDIAGKDLKDFIASIGIPTDLIQLDQQQQTSEVIGELKDNNEMVYTITYPTAWDFIAWRADYELLINQTDAFIYGSLSSRHPISRTTLLKALEAAPYKVFDVNLRAPFYQKEGIKELLQHANLVKLNENEIEVLGTWFTSFKNDSDRAKALKELFEIDEIILTKGANGSAYYGNDLEINQESLSVEVIDTVGSGDSFLAGFLAKKLNGESVLDGFKYANKIAAFITTKPGACPSYQKSEITSFNQILNV
ncbi:carbohydrate kinase [Pedobacter sp. UBA4863]|uniref:carbohydrate kinase family protein n=1 Tax=Pedobacter sp. UBA4863 TaxID=1947060 RepID=UPI0025DA99E6|nr:carbohydrate kinase [Pedobacter sp. UBA4863]